MPIPQLNENGELPKGVHQATLDDVVARFGGSTERRRAATAGLQRIHDLAATTGKLDRIIIFGSFVTAKPEPNDVDVVLVMIDDFEVAKCDATTRKLFDHEAAQREFGASIFWIRPSLLILDTIEEFIAYWQIKRDRTHRGIVEVRP